jgi:hypothetical protein
MKLNITKKLIQIFIEWGGGGKKMDACGLQQLVVDWNVQDNKKSDIP